MSKLEISLSWSSFKLEKFTLAEIICPYRSIIAEWKPITDALSMEDLAIPKKIEYDGYEILEEF